MNRGDVDRMPYGLAAIVLLVLTPFGLLWSSMAFMKGSIGLLAGIVIAVVFGLANNFVHRLMVRKGYREEREREPVSMADLLARFDPATLPDHPWWWTAERGAEGDVGDTHAE